MKGFYPNIEQNIFSHANESKLDFFVLERWNYGPNCKKRLFLPRYCARKYLHSYLGREITIICVTTNSKTRENKHPDLTFTDDWWFFFRKVRYLVCQNHMVCIKGYIWSVDNKSKVLWANDLWDKGKYIKFFE